MLGGSRRGADRLGQQLHRVAVAGGDLPSSRQRLDQVEAGDGEVAGEDVEQGGEARPTCSGQGAAGSPAASIEARTCSSIIS